MTTVEAVALVIGGFVAGVINAMAGGGSLITVSLLVWIGLPGDVANGSNRVGVISSMFMAARGFSAEGASGIRHSLRILAPMLAGSLLGAWSISQLDGDDFEKLFGLLMVPILILALRPPKVATEESGLNRWHPAVLVVVFFAVGLYAGAFQAGVGIILIVALSHSGLDLVMANSVKVIVVLVVTIAALPVFILAGQVDWGPALVLAAGLAVGGSVGARFAVRGGEKVLRPVLVGAVLMGSAKLLGVFG